MSRNATMTKELWNEAITAYETGTPIATITEKYGISKGYFMSKKSRMKNGATNKATVVTSAPRRRRTAKPVTQAASAPGIFDYKQQASFWKSVSLALIAEYEFKETVN